MEAAALARNLEKWILCSALPPPPAEAGQDRTGQGSPAKAWSSARRSPR